MYTQSGHISITIHFQLPPVLFVATGTVPSVSVNYWSCWQPSSYYFHSTRGPIVAVIRLVWATGAGHHASPTPSAALYCNEERSGVHRAARLSVFSRLVLLLFVNYSLFLSLSLGATPYFPRRLALCGSVSVSPPISKKEGGEVL